MLKIIGHIRPAEISGVALSGGVDSMALFSFLRNSNSKLTGYFFDHGTQTSAEARAFLEEYAEQLGFQLCIGKLTTKKPTDDSWEEFWRKERYGWLHSQQGYIATAHHLNDVAETYLWGMAHGHPRFIYYQQPLEQGPSNIIRPLLLTPKQELYDWCHRHQVPYIEDKSNSDVRFTRNRIRSNILPEFLKINPGFLKTVQRSWEEFNQKQL